MYSPKVSESLIPVLYQLRLLRRMSMTKLVHQLLVKALATEDLTPELVAIMPEIRHYQKEGKLQ